MPCVLRRESAPRAWDPAQFVRRETLGLPCDPALCLPRGKPRPFRRCPADSVDGNATLRGLATCTAEDHGESARKDDAVSAPVLQIKRTLGSGPPQVNNLPRFNPSRSRRYLIPYP